MREQGPSAPDLPVPWLARYPRVGQFLRKLMDDRVPNLAVLLILFNGANFFAGMQSVFNLAYHVPDRNLVLQRVVGLLVLIGVLALALVSTTAYSLGAVLAAESGMLLALLP